MTAYDFSMLTENAQHLASMVRETEALLQTVQEHTIVCVAEPGGRVIDVNEGFCRVSGYSRAEALAARLSMIEPGMLSAEGLAEMTRTVAAGTPWRGEFRCLAKGGRQYWVTAVISPILDEHGRVEKLVSVRTDITQAKAIEQRLRTSEALLDRAGALAGVGGWESDLRTGESVWSAQTYSIYEIETGTDLNTVDALSFFPEGARAQLEQAVYASTTMGTPWDLALPFVTAKGKALWVRSVGTSEFENGAAVRLVGAFQDISARKEAEEALGYERQLFASLMETIPDSIYFKDRESKFVRVNPELARRLGLKGPEEVLGKSDLDFCTAEHARTSAMVEQRIMTTGIAIHDQEEEALWLDKPGSWSLLTRMPLRDQGGRVIGTVGIGRDITSRKHLELQLKASKERMELAADAAGLGVWELDVVTGEMTCDERMYAIYGRSPCGINPRDLFSESVHGADSDRVRADVARAIKAGRLLDTEFRIVRPDGRIRHIRAAARVVRNSAGRALQMTGVNLDITERKQAELDSAATSQRERQANLAKSQFLANMSHEIRTPLNAVIGLSYLLGKTELAPPQEAMLGKISIASKSLLGVINDVLDLSKIEAGELIVERVPFDLRLLLRELSDVMTVNAESKGVTYSMVIEPDVPRQVTGDPTRLNQVLTNLISNAIKFTKDGGVDVRVQRVVTDVDGLSLHFSVRDSGIGIAKEAQGRLFAPFAQADASTTRQFGGTGLGLSIVKRLAKLMGGSVGLSSTPGVGSEFTVTLPFDRVAADDAMRQDAKGQPAAEAIAGLRVLVVDDSDVNCEVAQRILELEGAVVTIANDGQQALERLRATPTAFDVVLMDVQMPVLDGNQAARLIRTELLLAELPIIALTAGAMLSERALSTAAGMNAFVSKPFDPRMLVRTICEHVRMPAAARVAEPASVVRRARRTPLPSGQWPKITGVDHKALGQTIRSDVTLFTSLLGRMLAEFTTLEVPSLPVDAERLAELGRRMHKLKGSSGTLGAMEVYRTASESEQACMSGDAARAVALARSVVSQLEELKASYGSVVRSPPAAASHDSGGGFTSAELMQSVRGLITQLREQDLGALGSFRVLSNDLRAALGEDAFERLSGHTDALQFDAIAVELTTLLERAKLAEPAV